MEIEWLVNDEMRADMEPLLEKALVFAPVWVRSLSVRYDPEEASLLVIRVMPEYRTAHLKVGNGYFSDTRAEQQNSFIHEIMHMHTQALLDVFDGLLDAVAPDAALKRWAQESIRKANEGAVSDLAERIMHLLDA